MTNCPYPIVDLKDYVFFQEGPGLRKWQWTEEGMKVINVTNILSDGSVDISNTSRFISLDEFRQKYSHFAVEAGDVVVASSGNTYGKVGRVRACHLPIMMNTSVIRFHPINSNKLHPDYLYAFLRSDFFRGQIERFVVGSAQPNFGPTHVKLMQLILPDWEHQCRIASIVSAYDDLIENNTRRIEILEEMARRLYEEWFVQFRFPGHEGVEFKESLPSGWAWVTIEDAADNFDRLRKPLSKMQRAGRSGSYPYYGAAKVFDYIDDYLFEGRYLLMAEDGSVITPEGHPVLQITHGKFWVNNHTHILKGRHPFSTELIYLALSTYQVAGHITGAAQPKITQANMNRIPVLRATNDVHASFDTHIGPIFDLIETLERKNANLRAQRDLLLPKLISGEIDVSDIPMPT